MNHDIHEDDLRGDYIPVDGRRNDDTHVDGRHDGHDGHDDGRHDFDFLFGRWSIRNERLSQRLVGSDDWEVFVATQHCTPVLGGLGNRDDFVSDWQPSASARDAAAGTVEAAFHGMTLRLFNPLARVWSLYWASNRDGVLDPPVVGRFVADADGNRVGTFVGRVEHAGRPVLMKFTWDAIGANAAHWQQEFSSDDGATWETNWHMWLRRIDEHGRLVHDDAVIELRQYIQQPGQRDTLVTLFEAEFIEPQEAVGMHVLGQFRNLDDPERFVWLRGFESMPARASALQAFYGGAVWQRYREAANATLRDNDDVLLLRPARPGSGFAPAPQARASVGTDVASSGLIVAGICALHAPAETGFDDRFERTLAPLLRAHGAELLATYVTEPAANTFPRLPVREGEQVFAWFARFADVASHARHVQALAADAHWRAALAEALRDGLTQPSQQLRLAPTPRSELR